MLMVGRQATAQEHRTAYRYSSQYSNVHERKHEDRGQSYTLRAQSTRAQRSEERIIDQGSWLTRTL